MANTGKAEEIHHEETIQNPPAALEMTETETEPKKQFAVDTVHNDEAMKVLANYDGQDTWDKAEEKKVRRKIDARLLPILCLTYALQYYDKGMIAQAVSHFLESPLSIRLTDVFVRLGKGHLWTTNRPGTHRQSLLHGFVHLLPRLHRWSIPGLTAGTEIPRRASRFWPRLGLGHLLHIDNRLSQLAGPVCPAVLPGLSRGWHQSDLYARRRSVL